MFVAAPVWAASPWSDVTWTTQYLGDVMPDSASPAWTQSINWGYQPTHGYVSSDGDILTQSTWTPAGTASFAMGPTAWQGDTDSTVEFRIKIDDVADGQTYASQMLIGFPRGANADRRWELAFKQNGVDAGVGASETYAADLSMWHTFRALIYATDATYPGGIMEIYDLDSADPTTPVLTDNAAPGLTYANLTFGDLFSGSIGGTTNWDYVAWTNAGAFVPVPEPTLMALLGMGTLALLRRRRG